MVLSTPPSSGSSPYRPAGWGALLLAAALLCCAPAATAQRQSSGTLDAPASLSSTTLTSIAQAPPAVIPAPVPIKAAAAAPSDALAAANPYGLSVLWRQGDWVAKGCLFLLALMSVASWYTLVTRALAVRRLKKQVDDVRNVFKDIRLFAGRIAQLTADHPLRHVADAGSAAAHQYAALKPRVDYDTWLIRAIEQALNTLQTRLQSGMALLATVGSTAPFVGLFGTVWAIYTALVKIGASGQASIDRVAGPVGEALIMTAIGLAVAVPAVFGYNWLLRQNKVAFEAVRSFGVQLHSLLLATTDLATTAVPDAVQAENAAPTGLTPGPATGAISPTLPAGAA